MSMPTSATSSPVRAPTPGASGGYFKSQFSKNFRPYLGQKLTNGSKNGPTAPRTGTGYPHEGPFVAHPRRDIGTPYPPTCSLMLCQLPPYPVNRRPILCQLAQDRAAAALSCAKCRLILSHLPPYHARTTDLSCANCRLILSHLPPYHVRTADLSCAALLSPAKMSVHLSEMATLY